MPKSDDNDLLKRAQDALKKEHRSAPKEDPPTDKDDPQPSIMESIAWLQRMLGRWRKIAAVLSVMWNDWAQPVAERLNPVFQRIWDWYKIIFARFGYVDGANGGRVFSQRRAAVVVAGLAALTIAAPLFTIRVIIPETFQAIYDGTMLFSLENDTLYLGRPDLVDPDRELYQVMGCRDISQCDGGENTIYYRLRPNLILNVKYWFTLFEPYDPAEIAGAMVSELNECSIQYYGRRVKALRWYPYIINATCRPV